MSTKSQRMESDTIVPRYFWFAGTIETERVNDFTPNAQMVRHKPPMRPLRHYRTPHRILLPTDSVPRQAP